MTKTKFIKDFKEFAIKGNAVQLAVGVIIGSAFGKIVSSIVDDIIMPPLGWLIGGVDFTDLKIKLPQNPLNPDVQVTINYGNFIQATIVFIIVAFCVFLLVKGMAALSRALTKRRKSLRLHPHRRKRKFSLPKFATCCVNKKAENKAN